MDCKRCGALVPEGSVFCNKCGSKLDSIKKNDLSKIYTNISNSNPSNYKDTSYSNSKYNSESYSKSRFDFDWGNYPKKRSLGKTVVTLILLILPIIAIVAFVSYKVAGTDDFEKMKKLYEEGEYQEINWMIHDYSEIKDKDPEYRRIAYTGLYGSSYKAYEGQMKQDYPDYQWAVQYLISGYEDCKSDERFVDDPIRKEVLNTFKEKYINTLANEFSVTEEEADEIVKLNYDARREKYLEVAYRYIQKKNNKK